MSYSFQVRGTDKQSVKDSVFTEFTKVCDQQKEHALDAEAANAAAGKFIDMLADDPEKSIAVVVSGSLSWSDHDGVRSFTAANLSINAGLVARVHSGTAG